MDELTLRNAVIKSTYLGNCDHGPMATIMLDYGGSGQGFQAMLGPTGMGAGKAELARLEEQAKGAHRAKALHEQAAQFEEESKALAGTSEAMTETIKALDAFRSRMADELPIPGLSITGKEIRLRGVEWSQLNTATRVDVAVKVSTLRNRDAKLRVCFVDGAESLDKDHFDALIHGLENAGVQAFVAHVDSGPLRIETR